MSSRLTKKYFLEYIKMDKQSGQQAELFNGNLSKRPLSLVETNKQIYKITTTTKIKQIYKNG